MCQTRYEYNNHKNTINKSPIIFGIKSTQLSFQDDPLRWIKPREGELAERFAKNSDFSAQVPWVGIKSKWREIIYDSISYHQENNQDNRDNEDK